MLPLPDLIPPNPLPNSAPSFANDISPKDKLIKRIFAPPKPSGDSGQAQKTPSQIHLDEAPDQQGAQSRSMFHDGQIRGMVCRVNEKAGGDDGDKGKDWLFQDMFLSDPCRRRRVSVQ